MSDTPETEQVKAKLHTNWNDLLNHARQLERERDEARRKLNDLDVTAIHSCHNECQRPICVLRRERDEAREEANKLSGAYEDATNYYARIIELKEELDEAREALEFRRELYKVQEKCLEDARRERDEAREALAKILKNE